PYGTCWEKPKTSKRTAASPGHPAFFGSGVSPVARRELTWVPPSTGPYNVISRETGIQNQRNGSTLRSIEENSSHPWQPPFMTLRLRLAFFLDSCPGRIGKSPKPCTGIG